LIIPTRGKYLCELLTRDRQLPSGLWIADKIKSDKNDNIAKCIGVGDRGRKTCYTCHDIRSCKKSCLEKDQILPIVAKRTDIIHYKTNYGQKLMIEGKKYVFLENQDIIAIEDDRGTLKAPGSQVIIKKVEADKINNMFIPDQTKLYSGEFWGEVIAIGPVYEDKSLKVGDKVFYDRNEGYAFKPFYGDFKDILYSVKSKWITAKEKVNG